MSWTVQVIVVRVLNEIEHFTNVYYYELYLTKPLNTSFLKKERKK